VCARYVTSAHKIHSLVSLFGFFPLLDLFLPVFYSVLFVCMYVYVWILVCVCVDVAVVYIYIYIYIYILYCECTSFF